jgi:hypothetical protein
MHRAFSWDSGFVAVLEGAPRKVVFFDAAFEAIREVELDMAIMSVVGVETQMMPLGASGACGFWVLGNGPQGAMAWHYGPDDTLIPGDTLALSPSIPPGDTMTGLVKAPRIDGDDFVVTTDRHLLIYEIPAPGTPILAYAMDYAGLGILNPVISSGSFSRDINEEWQGEEPTSILVLLDRMAKKLYGIKMEPGAEPDLLGEVDISSWVGNDSAEGVCVDYADLQVLIAIHSGVDPLDRVVRLAIDWDADPDPEASYEDAWTIPKSVCGLGHHFLNLVGTVTLKIQDRNLTPYVEHVYEVTGAPLDSTALLAAAINDAGVYGAEVLVDDPQALIPSGVGSGPPDPTWFDPLADGADGGDLTNADYLDGLAATESKIDTNWIHLVGATTNALWTAALLHCAEMFEKRQSERFAILDVPDFETTAVPGSAEYLGDLQDYVDEIVEMAKVVADRNAVIFAGGARFLGSDGVEYNRAVAAACGGTMARLEVQKSLINKPVRNALRLVPEFGQGHIESLIQARVNCIRFKPGRGFIIAHSLTVAASGSDYSRVNDLRAVYYGAKAAREAAQPYVGEENDSAGEGLRRLESAMSRPLESMRDNGQIDAFDLTAVSTAQERLLGDVYVKLGIQPRRAMEMIYTTVYLK